MQGTQSHTAAPLPLLAVNRKAAAAAAGARRKWRLWLFIAVGLLVVGLAAGPILQRNAAPAPVAVQPAAPALPHLAALGVLTPRGGVTALMPAESVRSAVVTRLLVKEGTAVQAGDPIAEFDALPRAAANVMAAAAETRARQAALAQAQLALAADRADAAASLALARAQLAQAERSLARSRQLSSSNAVSQAALDDLVTARDIKQAALAQAEARQQLLADTGSPHPDIAVAAEALHAAEVKQQLAEIALSEATLRAPFAGQVLSVEARLGEPVSSAGIVRLAAEGPVDADLEVHQDNIARVAIGAPVVMHSDALAGELAGRVIAIGDEVRRQAVFDADPAANTDGRVLQVTVELDADSTARARNLIGLEVLADILPAGPSS